MEESLRSRDGILTDEKLLPLPNHDVFIQTALSKNGIIALCHIKITLEKMCEYLKQNQILKLEHYLEKICEEFPKTTNECSFN